MNKLLRGCWCVVVNWCAQCKCSVVAIRVCSALMCFRWASNYLCIWFVASYKMRHPEILFAVVSSNFDNLFSPLCCRVIVLLFLQYETLDKRVVFKRHLVDVYKQYTFVISIFAVFNLIEPFIVCSTNVNAFCIEILH